MKKQETTIKPINEFTDFPVFQHWDFNRKQFEPRALNNLSVKFNRYLERSIEDILKIRKDTFNRFFKTDAFLIPYLMHEFVGAARYAYYGNASYENTDNPNGLGGGDESIQEQFTVWIMGITTDDYRKDKGHAYSHLMYESHILREWLEESQLFKYVKELVNTGF